jgi:protein pelota
MRLIKKSLEKDNTGFVTLFPEHNEDFWHIYNLLTEGDTVTATTVRRIQKVTATGHSESERIRLTLTLEVVSINFEPDSESLRLTGKNISENPHVKLGAHHTLDIELNKNITIRKPYWDIISIERVEAATDPSQTADVAAVMLMEGLAQIFLITPTMTLSRARIEVSLPRKRKGALIGHEKALDKFFDNTLQAIVRHLNFEILSCVIIASPGFLKDQFYQYMQQEMQRQNIRVLIENKSKFFICHSSSAHKHAIKEILAEPALASRIIDTKAVAEVRALNEFKETFKVEPNRAVYGLRHVLFSQERQAIHTLLLIDELFRASNIQKRKEYVALVEAVRNGGGVVRIFSSLHVSGEQLKQYSGVAAILRFPLAELDDLEMEDEEQQQQ